MSLLPVRTRGADGRAERAPDLPVPGLRQEMAGRRRGGRPPLFPEQIGSAIQEFFSGRSFRKTARRIEEIWSIRDAEISPHTIRGWVLRYTQRAVALLQGTKVGTGGRWVLAAVPGNYSRRAWLVLDSDTGYILAVHVQRTLDQEALGIVLHQALARSALPGDSVTHCPFVTVGENSQGHSPRDVDSLMSVLDTLRETFPTAPGVGSREGADAPLTQPGSPVELVLKAFHRAFKSFDGHRSRGTVQHYVDGWAVTRNLFRQEEPSVEPPGDRLGVQVPFADWADVVRIDAGAVIPTPEP